MPRPQKYHTKLDKSAANRAKSKRCYDKKKAANNAEQAKLPGRPRKYHTTQEKQIASKGKNQRYYERHKSVIKVRQSVRYRKTQEQNTFMLPTATSHRTGSTDPSSTTITSTPRLQTEVPNTATTQCDCDTDIEHWCIQTEAVATRLQDLMGQKLPREYLEHVYASYTFNHRKDDIRDKITAISKLQRKVDQCHGNILQLAGVGAELQRADNIAKQVRKLVSWLEEILVWAMHDPRILVAMHHQRELLFQTPT